MNSNYKVSQLGHRGHRGHDCISNILIKVWVCASQKQLNCLFLLQKKIRIMSFSHYIANTNPLFFSIEVFPLRKIFFL